uniref:Uncharacterized protein n=1 Tax=Panagrolaimus sp. ES5 TaxID=591445 RepID=A0AC34FNA5_9BILA
MYDAFKLLASSATYVNLESCQIINNDGSTVMLEKILEAVPNLEEFDYSFKTDNFVNAKNMLDFKNLGNLKKLKLWRIPEAFNLDDFSTFIKDRSDFHFCLIFNNNISDEYKNQLDVLVDAIIESQIPTRFIAYDGQDEKKRKIMNERYRR